MNKHTRAHRQNRPLMLFIGTVFLIAGCTLILNGWQEMVEFFKGSVGVILLVAGVGILYSIKK